MPPAREKRPSQEVRETRAYRATVAKLGAKIRELRHARALTLEAAAELASVDLKHLQKVEAGTLNVTLATLVRIAVGLGVEVRDLFPARPTRRAG